MPRKPNLNSAEDQKQHIINRKKIYYQKNKEKLKQLNKDNYHKKKYDISDEQILDKIKVLLDNIKDKNIIMNYLNK
mgnify:CR=1 FL=1|tara:strand:- start:117 stop:344 length:228 start_codon:yes stop_codon:yes gene_type:complete